MLVGCRHDCGQEGGLGWCPSAARSAAAFVLRPAIPRNTMWAIPYWHDPVLIVPMGIRRAAVQRRSPCVCIEVHVAFIQQSSRATAAMPACRYTTVKLCECVNGT